ncbi:MAG TPA: serine/threonine-protein kinase [Actinophytocola sp.]|uniref:serine/threonine-protein kinase n=1 Tax=Actinophytocola sp. TaxID=1872138 RepID=UPI002DDD68AE|nr:serine/threonine-protein kinase [Actinophytocola sp.]HEV2780927.1 serine/threonine-protein kinase [Actinophytocola sp.]
MAAGPLDGYRLLSEPTDDGLFAVAPAIRDDGTEVTVRVVVAKLDRTQLRRVRDEAAALDNVLAVSRNPFVLPLLHHDRDAGGRPVLVTARRGRSLADELAARGPLPVAEALQAVLAAASGLELLHRNDTVHQAISPAALLRQPTGHVVLDCPLLPALAEIAAATTEGTGHEPPEQLAGQDWTPAGEVYALASTLWTLLSGRPPFSGSRAERVLFAGQSPVGQLPEAAAKFTTALRWALSSEPGSRPPSVAAFAKHLRDPQSTIDVRSTVPSEHRGAELPRSLGGEYELLARIGEGGMGTVWRARRRADGMLVAAKLLRPDLVTDPDSLMRLVREASVVQDLDHPHLVRVRDLYIAKGKGEAAVIMDLVEGTDLRRLLVAGELDRAEGLRLLSEVASGLTAVHASGVVHRDLKPANILVCEQNGRTRALLTDFGLVKAVDGAPVTQLGYLPGSPPYIAPELVNRESPTPASDIYALGITTYEVLAGHRPFAGSTEDILRQHQLRTPPRPPDLPEAAWSFLAACLAKDPRGRPTALEASEVLSDLARELLLTGPAQPVPVIDAESTVRIAVPAEPPWLSSPDVAPQPVDPHATVHSGVTPTEISAHPPHPRPAEPPDRRRARRRWLVLTAIAGLVAALGIGVGIWVGQRDSTDRITPPPTTTTLPGTDHKVPVRIDTADGRVTLSWPPESRELPGLTSFVILRNGQLLDSVPSAIVSFPDLDPLPSACYVVIALGVTTPSEPSAGPACLPR